ncbi:hypothetical protein PAXRUDRAFT_152017 [Paxillus rubicundulus Ve08.2h10]|uniref:Uncharacterized protein n=1 Tax=Paxillus rubicundulus Ve08.2h10 TaxID=930991 RepID=A0A0D0DWH2_9AGAM|nr:hypothetical protein PAXRUDRAFT_152017 [Paxillus rubicundulus Ve08.2h10]
MVVCCLSFTIYHWPTAQEKGYRKGKGQRVNSEQQMANSKWKMANSKRQMANSEGRPIGWKAPLGPPIHLFFTQHCNQFITERKMGPWVICRTPDIGPWVSCRKINMGQH